MFNVGIFVKWVIWYDYLGNKWKGWLYCVMVLLFIGLVVYLL